MLKSMSHFALARKYYTSFSFIPKNLALCMCATLLTSILINGCKSKPQETAQNVSIPVSSVELKEHNIVLDFEYPARLTSPQSVNVYARVEGILMSQNFKEGDIVKEGEKLFKIDPTRYDAKVAIAKAQYDSAKANLAKAKKDWNRTEKLYKEGVLTVDTYDDSLYNYQSAQASVDNTRATLKDAEIDLGYTDVIASITGRVGMRKYDVGNLVGSSSNQDVLTTITQLTPIYAEFSIPSNDFYYIRSLTKNVDRDNVHVELVLENNVKYGKTGKIDFIDSVLDSQTQSVKARAIFNNDEYQLLPNEFARLVIKGFSITNGISIPQNALLQDAEGSYVYIIKDSKAHSARVNVGRTLKNGDIVIINGLNQGDELITSNLTQIREGTGVSTKVNSNEDTEANDKV